MGGILNNSIHYVRVGLEVLLRREDVAAPQVPGRLILEGLHDPRLLVLADAALEKVALALQRDHLHPVERVGRVVQLPVACEGERPNAAMSRKLQAGYRVK